MEKVVLDASVIVKWFVDEIYSDKALKLRDSCIEGKMLIIASTLLPFEVLSALKYTHLFKEDA
ncbi:MAG: type II toxin-antitoxin system VapC family toxin [Candidatus Asgardarchaeia archaeon]